MNHDSVSDELMEKQPFFDPEDCIVISSEDQVVDGELLKLIHILDSMLEESSHD